MVNDFLKQLLPQFDLDNEPAYRQWRERKLLDYPADIEQLIVEIRDPAHLSKTEREAMQRCIRKANMVIFSGPTASNPDKTISRQLGAQFGLTALDSNTGADSDGVTSLEVRQNQWHRHYIPYTNRAIHWHTDGYYNELSRQIYGLQLHCVRAAAEGGENALMDHEIAYILLRDRDPALVAALMHEEAMTIPENRVDEKVNRPDRSGPVFMAGADGTLHMRYTARKRHVIWREDSITRHAVTALNEILNSDSPYTCRATLQPGQGLLSNNVLHDRSGFDDDPEAPRLLYRLRYFDRIAAG
ncbi:MAG: TauD/TfdA family dioxygenase [Gammaproteobacteria bacterium]|nr:TauD/TfdA family dioxygenase [Gammaproteobacteria bacterium]